MFVALDIHQTVHVDNVLTISLDTIGLDKTKTNLCDRERIRGSFFLPAFSGRPCRKDGRTELKISTDTIDLFISELL